MLLLFPSAHLLTSCSFVAHGNQRKRHASKLIAKAYSCVLLNSIQLHRRAFSVQGFFPFRSVGIEKMYRPNYRTNLSSFVKRAKYNRRKHIAQHQFFKCILILDSIGKQTHKKPLKLVCIGYNWRDVHKNALIKLKKTDFWRAMKSINSHLERIDSNTCMQLCMRMHR